MARTNALLAAAFSSILLAGSSWAGEDRPISFDGSKGSVIEPAAPAPAPSPGELESQGAHYWVVIEAQDRAARNAAADAGLSLEEFAAGKVGGTINAQGVRNLRSKGIKIIKQVDLDSFGPEQFPKPDEAYHDYKEVLAELDGIVASAPGVASRVKMGSSLNGLELAGLRFNTTASGSRKSSKPGIVFLGTHHAREHLSTETPLLLAKWIADNRAKPEVASLLATRDIWFFPLVNPDGAEFDHASGKYKMHRKNMRKNDNGTTGVDLNRNYGFGWGGGGASTDPGSDTYRGPSAFSEPESQAVKRFAEAHPNLKILLSYHTFSELILYPWGHLDEDISDARALAAYKAMAAKMAGWTGYTPQKSSDLYIASGDTCDWAWGERGIFAFTFELTPSSMWGGGFYPGAGVIASTVEKNIRPALYLIDLADDPYRAATQSVAAQAVPSTPSVARTQ